MQLPELTVMQPVYLLRLIITKTLQHQKNAAVCSVFFDYNILL